MNDPQAEFGEDGNAIKTGYATCYSYNQQTGEYVGSFEFLTLIGSGIPGSSTRIAPPENSDGQVAIFNDGEWSLVADHRGEIVYSTKDQSKSVVVLTGDYPEGTTPLNPSTIYDTWDGNKWITDTNAQLKGEVAAANEKKKSLLAEANAFTGPWQTQLMLGIISDADKASLTTWMKYYQQVQSVDTSKAPDIGWPEKPE